MLPAVRESDANLNDLFERYVVNFKHRIKGQTDTLKYSFLLFKVSDRLLQRNGRVLVD